MILIGLVLARFLHFASLATIFGIAWSPAYMRSSSVAATLDRVKFWAAPVALVSAIGWFELTVAHMANSAMAAFDPTTVWFTASTMEFGQLWIARTIGLCLLWIILLWKGGLFWTSGWSRYMELGLSGVLLSSLALTGHSDAGSGGAPYLHQFADSLHLLAAGLWIGGLAALVLLLSPKFASEEPEARHALKAFSKTGVFAVITLLCTGLINSFFLVQTPVALVTTPYGKILCVKLALFAAMVVLAALNRKAASKDLEPLRDFRRRVILEQALSAGVLGCVAILGTISPAIDMSL